MNNPISIAITGGIGSGKTEALSAFSRQGVATISSDAIVHKLLKRSDIQKAVVAHFGNRITYSDGQINRTALAEIVFNNRQELIWLEQLLHPIVSEEYLAWRTQLAKQSNPPTLCITEVPLLYETGSERNFDYVIVISAPAKIRAARSGATGDQREQRLLDDKEKISRADYAYTNTGSIEQLNAFVESVIKDVKLQERELVKK